MRTTSATPLPRSWWAALSILSLGALGLTACDPKAEPDNDGRQEGDADADSDADTDADSDADADADLGAFEGTITWSSSEDDVESCAGTVAVSGAEYTGVCPDCDFAFSTDGVVASGDAPADCGLSPLLSLVEEGGAYRDLRIGHSNELTWYGETFSDVLIVGFTGYYGYDEPGYDDGGEPDTAAPPPAETVWIPVAGGGVPWESSFTRDGDQIAWSMSYGWSDYQANYRDYCGSYYGYEDYGADGRPEAVYGAFREGTTNYGGDFADLSDLDCGTYYTGYGYYDGGGGGGDVPPEPYSYGWWSDGEILDVWEIDTVAGETVAVSIDTSDPTTAFDPTFWLNDGESCTVGQAWSSFVCTWPVDDSGSADCPSMKFDSTGGTWQVVVMSQGACAGDLSEYELRVDALTDPNLRLIADNADQYTMIDHRWSINGAGTLTP